MKEVKKVYGQFELLKKGEHGLSKVTYSSLEKYSRSPYLQSNAHLMKRSRFSPTSDTPIVKTHHHIVLLSRPLMPFCTLDLLRTSNCLN